MTDLLAVAIAIQAEWASAFAAQDTGRLASLYAAEVQFWGSTSTLHTDQGGVHRYFEGLPPGYTEARFTTPSILSVGPDAFSAACEVVFVRQDAELPYRMTHVLVRSGDDWRIAVHHASPRPS